MKKYLFLGLMVLSLNCFSQNRNSVWCFGDSAGIDFSNITNPIPFASAMDGRGSCASIADSLGNLLFYANTYGPLFSAYLWTSTHDSMPNGKLISDGYYNEIQIIPKPGTQNMYYVFYLGAAGFFDGIYFAIVDMSLNGGLGAVTVKQQIVSSGRKADCIQLVKHGNGRDWWLISKMSSTSLTHVNRFIEYLITPYGRYGPFNFDFGGAFDQDFQKIIFNNSYTKIMNLNTVGYMCEYDFDRCTGLINNPNTIYAEIDTFPYNRLFWEGAYSSDDSVFYASTSPYFGVDYGYLLQYDLKSLDIVASCDTIDSTTAPIGPGAVRLAPDNKIYYAHAYENNSIVSFPYADTMYNYINMNLSVINDPNNLGAACNFQPFSFYLGGKRTYYGLPNNPNYDLGSLIGSACDTLTSISPSLSNKEATMHVHYHPSWQTLFVNAQNIKGKNCLLQIFDMNGRCVFTFHDKAANGYFTHDVPLQATANGIYIIKLTTEKETLTSKFVKQ